MYKIIMQYPSFDVVENANGQCILYRSTVKYNTEYEYWLARRNDLIALEYKMRNEVNVELKKSVDHDLYAVNHILKKFKKTRKH